MSSPRAPADRIAWFVDTYGPRGFAHAGDLLPILHRNDPDEAQISLFENVRLDAGLRAMYRDRAQHVASHPSPTHPSSFAGDLKRLADFFTDASDQPLRMWCVALSSGLSYVVFELVNDGAVACVESADQRSVDPYD
ncbi:MAG TPA: hypothetical protein VLB44_07040 [Kofleriaceae bacterium]|nr:hypothetical protein [Kofleriaceae bacterium]